MSAAAAAAVVAVIATAIAAATAEENEKDDDYPYATVVIAEHNLTFLRAMDFYVRCRRGGK